MRHRSLLCLGLAAGVVWERLFDIGEGIRFLQVKPHWTRGGDAATGRISKWHLLLAAARAVFR